jgi:hypothetical protein
MSIPCAVLATLVLLPLRDARAQSQTEEDETKVFVAAVNFREGAVGVVVLEKQPGGTTTISTSFFEFRAKSGEVHKLGRSEYKSLFPEFEAKKLATLPEWGEPPQAVVTSDGDRFETVYTDCEPQDEGGPICKGQFIIHNGDKWQLDTGKQCPFGCSVLIANKWNDQFWIGLGALGELDWYGFGIQVYDLRTKKLIFADARAPIPVLLRLDPSGETMWLAGRQLWGFNEKFGIVRKCVPSRSSGHIKFECRDAAEAQ